MPSAARTVADAVGSRSSRSRRAVAVSYVRSWWLAQRPFPLTALTFLVASRLLEPVLPYPQGTSIVGSYYGLSLTWLAYLLPVAVAVTAFRHRLDVEREHPGLAVIAVWGVALERLRQREFSAGRVVGFALVTLLLPPVMATFTAWKIAIPHLRPFEWDPFFSQADRWLHGGRDPWALLQPVLGHPLTTRALGYLYGFGWLAVVNATVFVAACDPDVRRRNQYLTTYVLAWGVLGVVAATVFSSAGPCYFVHVAPRELADRYVPLMTYLASVTSVAPVPVLSAQPLLWTAHEARVALAGGGVAAMPSLHVAMAVLSAIYAWHWSRVLGIAAAVFAVVTFLASVHLGWHYAVDGYASAIGVAVLWIAVGPWVRRNAAEARGTIRPPSGSRP